LYGLTGRELKALRIALVLLGILVLLISTAGARSSGTTNIDIVGSDAEVLNIASSVKDLKLDIIGSLAEDIKIISPTMTAKDVEIVGSKTKRITIVPPGTAKEYGGEYGSECPYSPAVVNNYYTVCQTKTPSYCPPKCPPQCPPQCPPKAKTPDTGGVHMGVDAWHGQYWYGSQPATPKWPQIAEFV
jgi:hypothetical protein